MIEMKNGTKSPIRKWKYVVPNEKIKLKIYIESGNENPILKWK